MPRERDYEKDDDTPIRSTQKGFPRYLLVLAVLGFLGVFIIAGVVAVVVFAMKPKPATEPTRYEKYTPGVMPTHPEPIVKLSPVVELERPTRTKPTTPVSPPKKGDSFTGVVVQVYLTAALDFILDNDGKLLGMKDNGDAIKIITKDGVEIMCISDPGIRLNSVSQGDSITVSGELADYGSGVRYLYKSKLLATSPAKRR